MTTPKVTKRPKRRAHSTISAHSFDKSPSKKSKPSLLPLTIDDEPNIKPRNARRTSKTKNTMPELSTSQSLNSTPLTPQIIRKKKKKKKTSQKRSNSIAAPENRNNTKNNDNTMIKKRNSNNIYTKISKSRPITPLLIGKQSVNSNNNKMSKTPRESIKKKKIKKKKKDDKFKSKSNKFAEELFNNKKIKPNLIEFNLNDYSTRDGIKMIFNVLRDELNKQETRLLNKVVEVEVSDNGNIGDIDGNGVKRISIDSDDDDDDDEDDDIKQDSLGLYSRLNNILSSDSNPEQSPRLINGIRSESEIRYNPKIKERLHKQQNRKKKSKKNKHLTTQTTLNNNEIGEKIIHTKNESNILYIDKYGAIEYIRKIGMIIGKTFEDAIKIQDDAINKLKQILEYEQEATKERDYVEKLKASQQKKMQIANEKKIVVEMELEKVAPLVERAKASLGNITKTDIDELRALRAPPKIAFTVLSSVIFIVYGRKPKKDETWTDARKMLNFKMIKEIVNYDTMKMIDGDNGNKKIKYVVKKFLSDEDYNVDRANLASKVLGPCIEWVQAQTKYAHVLAEIKPLLDEIQALEKKIIKSNKEIERTTILSETIKMEIKKARGEMLEMIGYKKYGDRYYGGGYA